MSYPLLGESLRKSILLFWFFKLIFLKFCFEQFHHILFCLHDSCFTNSRCLTRFFKKLLHNVLWISHRIVGSSASTGVTHSSDLLTLSIAEEISHSSSTTVMGYTSDS